MVKSALFCLDIDTGREVIAALDRAGLNVPVVMWAYLPEYEDWRMVVASKEFDRAGILEGYGLLIRSLKAGSFSLDEPSIVILPMSDPFIRDLRKQFAKSYAKHPREMRIGLQTIGNCFLEDGYVYRIA